MTKYLILACTLMLYSHSSFASKTKDIYWFDPNAKYFEFEVGRIKGEYNEKSHANWLSSYGDEMRFPLLKELERHMFYSGWDSFIEVETKERFTRDERAANRNLDLVKLGYQLPCPKNICKNANHFYFDISASNLLYDKIQNAVVSDVKFFSEGYISYNYFTCLQWKHARLPSDGWEYPIPEGTTEDDYSCQVKYTSGNMKIEKINLGISTPYLPSHLRVLTDSEWEKILSNKTTEHPIPAYFHRPKAN